MTTGPCVSKCENVTARPCASGRVKSGTSAPSLRAFSAAPELMSCPMGLSKSCSRPAGNQLAPSAINSSICCCNRVFVGIFVAMIFLLALAPLAMSPTPLAMLAPLRSAQHTLPTPFRAVDETPGLLVGCSHCLLHFHCLLNSLQLNLDSDNRTGRQLHCRTPAHAKFGAIDLRRSS